MRLQHLLDQAWLVIENAADLCERHADVAKGTDLVQPADVACVVEPVTASARAATTARCARGNGACTVSRVALASSPTLQSDRGLGASSCRTRYDLTRRQVQAHDAHSLASTQNRPGAWYGAPMPTANRATRPCRVRLATRPQDWLDSRPRAAWRDRW